MTGKTKIIITIVVLFVGIITYQGQDKTALQSIETPIAASSTYTMNINNANASFIGENPGDATCYVIGVGDVNRDFINDILIGTPKYSNGASKLYIIFGKVSGWSQGFDLSNADASFIGENAYDGFSIAGVGDINGDFIDDILVGADEYGVRKGKTYLLFGKTSGWSQNVNLSQADASFIGEENSDYSGRHLAGAGDVNGDGYDDFLIGAQYSDFFSHPYGGSDYGKSYLFLGKSSGWLNNDNVSSADVLFVGENPGDKSGKVAGVGDVNGDGLDDILIGARANDDGGEMAGKAYLFLGKSSGWSETVSLSNANASFIGENPFDYAGSQVNGAGDVNGDGYDDFLIGSYTNDDGGEYAGKTYLIFGRASGWVKNVDLANANASFIGEAPGDNSGSSIAGAIDLNWDGYDDILIGAPGNDDYGYDAGVTYLIYGNATGWSKNVDLSNADLSIYGEKVCGRYIAGAIDVNLDGFDDILIGFPSNDDGGESAGKVYLIFGPPRGTKSENPTTTIPGYSPVISMLAVFVIFALLLKRTKVKTRM